MLRAKKSNMLQTAEPHACALTLFQKASEGQSPVRTLKALRL